MKKILLLTSLGLFCGLTAQVKTNNFGFGVSPFGMMNIKKEFTQSGKTENMRIDYKSYLNAHLFYERQFGGAGLLVEGTYGMSKFEKVDNNIINFYDTDASYDKDISIYSAAVYGSYAINKQKMIQIPLYLGVSVDYVNGNPINVAFVSLAAKARLKFYVSPKIALYGGYNYRTGIGLEGTDTEDTSKPKVSSKLNLNYADLGATFSF